MRRYLRFIAFNLILVTLLLAATNYFAGLYLKFTAGPSRAELPNYASNRALARQIFQEYNSLTFQYEPFVGWKTRPFQGKTTTIGPDGLRETRQSSSNPSNVPTIRFFGGSTLWGEGADDEHTIPALFESANPEYKVYNHGQLAYNSRQNLDALISLYEESKPSDIVVFYDGVNDAAFLCPSGIDVPGHRLVPMFRKRLYTGEIELMKSGASKIFVDNILRLVARFKHEDATRLYDCLSDPSKAEAIADFMIKNWEMAHELVSGNGGRFIAILQPAAFVGNPRTDHLQFEPEFKKNFARVYELMSKKLKSRHYSWVYDLTDSFDGNEYIYIDFCHVSPNGNAIIARKLGEILQ